MHEPELDALISLRMLLSIKLRPRERSSPCNFHGSVLE